jgi:flagella basal body P-ring formation protein FlgA
MIFSFFIFLLSSVAAPVDSAVASAVETVIALRTNAAHEIEYRSVPRELSRIASNASVRIVDEPRASYRGIVNLPVEVTSPAGPGRRYILSVRVRTFESVAVASALIGKHTTLAPEQVVMQTIETTQLSGTPVTDAVAMAGMRTKQIIGGGSVITGSMLEPLPLIASGAPVRVRVHSDNVTLSAPGIAKTDGWKGSVIPVEVSTGRQHLKAKVVDAQNVEVIE